jgi:capsular polysaccharide biosynthesis protein
LPNSTVLEISIQGPSGSHEAEIANRLADDVSTATLQYFQIFELTPLDPAGTVVKVSPRTGRNMLFGGLAGLLAGIVLATLSLSLTPERRRAREVPQARPVRAGGAP